MRRFFVLMMFLLAGRSLRAQPAWVVADWGPFYSKRVDVHGNQHQHFLGPVGERIETPEGWTFTAWRPLMSRWNHEGDRVLRQEVLWPVASGSQREHSVSWRVLLGWWVDWDVTNPESRERLWILPFWFSGRDKDGKPYAALFPVGGTIREFFFWDRIEFVLFPLHVRSQVKEVKARTWLWPLISRTEGPNVRRFRIFPLYGYHERVGKGRKTFILWPLWTHARYEHPKSSGYGWMLFPLAGHVLLTDQESWWLFPPFFRYSVGQEQSRMYGPWPFFQRESGAVEKFYAWPLWGTKRMGEVEKGFFLWPLGHHERIQRDEDEIRRLWFLPFLHDFRETRGGGEVPRAFHYTKLWPVYSHLEREPGTIRRTVFPDLNPFRDGPVERNYASFWRLYHREQVGERVDTEILWGLWRSGAREDGSRYRSLFPIASWSDGGGGGHFSFLKGLLAREGEGGKKRWRVLYLFRFGGNQPMN